jgi:hypothetical protein
VDVLTEAALKTRTWAIEHTSDLDAGSTFCGEGGTVVAARESDLAALRKATAPALRAIGKAPGNQSVIAAISAVKESTGDDPSVDTCSGESVRKHKPGQAEAALNGTYRFTITPDDFAEAGRSESQAYHNAGTQTYVLRDGEVHYRLDPTEHEFGKDPVGADETSGTYQVDGDAITFWFPAYNEEDRVIFEADDQGNLTMRALDLPDSDVTFLMTSQVWEKIE